MKVLLRRNVPKLGKIGDIVETKNGYARNYLLPQRLAVVPTEANIKAIEADKRAYLEQLAKERAELEAQAQIIEGTEVTISARCNEEGHLYGSVGPAQISSALAEQGVTVDAKNIVLDNPIRQLDKYDVTVRFNEEVSATIQVWIVPVHELDVEGESDEVEVPADQETVPAGEAEAETERTNETDDAVNEQEKQEQDD